MPRTSWEEKDIKTVKLVRSPSVGFGLTVTCGDTCDTVLQGAFIESLLPNGPADQNGNLSSGDHILVVNGIDVRNDQFLDVVDLIKDSDSLLELVVAKPAMGENRRMRYSDTKEISELLGLKIETWLKNESYRSVSGDRLQSPSLLTDHTVNGVSDCQSDVFHKTNPNSVEGHLDSGRNCIPDIIPSDIMNSNTSLENLQVLSCDDQMTFKYPNKYYSKLESKTSNSSVVKNCLQSEVKSEVFEVSLMKKNGSLGLNIYQGADPNSFYKHIYVHSLIAGGAAEGDERIKPGDKVLKVNGISLQNLSYQQVVTLLRESSLITNLVIERGCPVALNPIEELQSICSSIHGYELLDGPHVNPAVKNSTLPYVKHGTCVKDCSSSELQPQLICTCNEHSSVANSFEDFILYNKKCVNGNMNSVILKSTNSGMSTNFNALELENRLHVDSAKDSVLNSEHAMMQECCENNKYCIPERVLNFSCAAVNTNKNSLPDFDATNTGDKQSSPRTTKVMRHGSDVECKLNDISGPLASYKSTPNLADVSKEKKFSQRENMFRNKSSDCLTSSLPYFEINLLNSCHERNGIWENGVDKTPKAPVRRKKFRKLDDIYSYLNSENTFTVTLKKGTRGLGFSISGGRESSKDLFSQFIRIKKLYPLQPAIESGKLFVGDVILQVNDMKMIGLTNTEALEILRCVSSDVTLNVFRPSNCNIPSLSICKDLLPIFLDSPPSSASSSLSSKWSEKAFCNDVGEFKITLLKKDGSLGFTVCRNEGLVDGTVAGIYVKALIREPAVSDGRIHPGDRITQVNGTDISLMTHTEAVTFLRNAAEVVTLTLFRSDPPLSPVDVEDNHHVSKPLRWEAIELLNDRLKHKDNDSLFEKKKLHRKVNKISDETSSVESNTSTSKSSSNMKDTSLDVLFHSNSILNVENPGMQRCQRPKSLDVLNSSDKKQVSENEDSFHRQTSVTGALVNQKNKNFEDAANHSSGTKTGVKTLLKWRGTSFPSEGAESVPTTAHEMLNADEVSDEDLQTLTQELPCKDIVADHVIDYSNISSNLEKPMMQSIEISLDRGWHGRLGFSLRDPSADETSSVTDALPFSPEVKAVYPNSLAAKDGRIKVGDRLMEVNSESFCNKPAVEAIDILRKTRGVIRMVFCRLTSSDFSQ